MTEPPLRALPILPNRASCTHFSKLLSLVSPRVRVISPALKRPGSFLMTNLPSAAMLDFLSMTSCSIFSPETSWICLITTPSISMPNEWPTELSRSGSVMRFPSWVGRGSRRSLVDEARAAGELGEPEDHELGRLDRRHPDLAHDLAGVDSLRRVGLPVALDVERLVGRQPEQRPLAPLVDEECADRAADAGPQGVVVRFEDDPLGPVQDGLLEVVEQPPDVEVAPFRLGGQGARAPDADTPAGERPDAVDPHGVEQ